MPVVSSKPVADSPAPPVVAGQTTRPRARWRPTPRNRHDALVFLAFAGPNLLLIVAFAYRPLLSNLYYSTLSWTLGSPRAQQIGLGNYIEFFTSSSAWEIMRVTALFTLATVGGSMLLGLAISLALNRRVPGAGLARAAVFSPYVLSGVGVGLVWVFVFDPTIGVLAAILRSWGLPSPEWFNDPSLSLIMLIVVYVWKNMGYAAVIYLAGLQTIPRDLLEAAALDGAGPLRTFRSVVLPLLGPTTFFLLITSVLNSLQAFDLIRIMTPLGRGTTTLIYEAYLQAFGGYNRAGYSAAVSTVLFVLLVAFTIVQLRILERRVHYR